MKIILFIVLTLLLFLVITTLFKQSYNVLFFFLKKPILWIVFVGMLNFLVFYISSLAPKSYYVVLWASLVAFFDNLPPKNKVMTKAELNGLCDEMLDIKSSRLKYRIGLFSYALGGFLGWLVFFGKIEVVSM